mmetsp:Transcript_19478/g.54288  ORF Transcript_19478/g.54288 Transcript_19478/m.54288 type:complete len:252 (+) Transcript_19478:563-1318(+)
MRSSCPSNLLVVITTSSTTLFPPPKLQFVAIHIRMSFFVSHKHENDSQCTQCLLTTLLLLAARTNQPTTIHLYPSIYFSTQIIPFPVAPSTLSTPRIVLLHKTTRQDAPLLRNPSAHAPHVCQEIPATRTHPPLPIPDERQGRRLRGHLRRSLHPQGHAPQGIPRTHRNRLQRHQVRRRSPCQQDGQRTHPRKAHPRENRARSSLQVPEGNPGAKGHQRGCEGRGRQDRGPGQPQANTQASQGRILLEEPR